MAIIIEIIKELNIEVSSPNVFQAVVAKQYDMNTRFIKATFVDNGDKIYIDPEATVSVVINALRPDGEAKAFDGKVNQDGTVTVPLHSWMLELVGTVTCDISVIDTETDDNKKLTTTSFILLVEKAAYGGDDVTSDPQYDVLVRLVETCSTAAVAAEEALQKSNEANSKYDACVTATEEANKAAQRANNAALGKPGEITDHEQWSEIYNDYDKNRAVGKFTHAEGTGTKAVGMVFGIVSIDGSNVITLSDSAEGILSVGMVYSCQLLGTYNDVGKITAISGNNVTVDALPLSTNMSQSPFTSIDGNFLWIPSNPEAGTLDIFSQATHAEGMDTIASGVGAHAEGRETHACGKYSHAEGRKTKAYYGAHAEGLMAEATGHESHAEGFDTRAVGEASHAEGWQVNAKGKASHAEGFQTIPAGDYSHAEGYSTETTGAYAHAEGRGTKAQNTGDHAEGYGTIAKGGYSHAEGMNSVASGDSSHAEGQSTASGAKAHSEGRNTVASGSYSHAEGDRSVASAIYSHAEGVATESSGEASHAEGHVTKATAKGTHAEGINTEATTEGAHAEGHKTKAMGHYCHAEGTETQALASGAHAEGSGTKATNFNSHAEGGLTTASGNHSHAEGYNTEASGWGSHAGGHGTKATANSQTAIGRWNVEEGDALLIVGNGSDDDKRSNAMSVKANGVIKSAGANQVLVNKFLEPGVVINNGTFTIGHYAAVNLGNGGGDNCIASVRKSGTDYIIEGNLISSYSNGNGDIYKIKITANSSYKITYMEIVTVGITGGVAVVSDWVAGNGTTPPVFISEVTGLVPIV